MQTFVVKKYESPAISQILAEMQSGSYCWVEGGNFQVIANECRVQNRLHQQQFGELALKFRCKRKQGYVLIYKVV